MVSCSENNFRDCFKDSDDFFFILDVEGNIIETNNTVPDRLGYSYKELIGRNILLVHPPEFREEVGKIIRPMATGEKFLCQIPLQTKNKENILVHTSVFSCLWNSRQALICVSRNMKDLKDSLLYKQQKLLADISQLLNSTTNPDSVLDDVLKFIGEHTNVSRVCIVEDMEDIKNQTAGKMTHNWCNTKIDPQIRVIQKRQYKQIPSWKKLLLNEGCIYSNQIEDLPKDLYKIFKPQGVKTILVYPLHVQKVFYGSIIFYECVSTQIWTKEEIDLMRTVSNTISNALERKLVLDKLEKNELHLKLAIESAKEGLWDWDIKTGHLFYTPMWNKILGCKPEEVDPSVLGWAKRIHPDDLSATMKLVNNHLNGEAELYEATYRVKTNDGKWKWVLDHGMVVQRDADKKPLRAIGTSIDITKQKETELKYKKAVDTQNKLFSIVAHDLRGPIGNILPIIDLLTGDKELDEVSRNIFKDELKNSAKNTFNLLENLLNWSRSQTNALTLKPVPFDLSNTIKDNVNLLTNSANQKEIAILVNTTKALPAFADVNTISLVIRNLLSNAIKFTPKNGAITISAIDDGTQIEVAVTDNGVGMEKKVVDNLFTSNLFNSTYGTNNEKGSGLGLVLCKDFVERNGGQIRVESALGKGSNFILKIPKTNPYA